MPKLKKRSITYYSFYCPGCHSEHIFSVAEDNSQWIFNGNIDKPSFTPSLLNRLLITNPETGQTEEKSRCHLFVTDGKIIFCNDCTHDLKNKTVPI